MVLLYGEEFGLAGEGFRGLLGCFDPPHLILAKKSTLVKNSRNYANPKAYKYISRVQTRSGLNWLTPRTRTQKCREVASSTITNVHILTALRPT